MRAGDADSDARVSRLKQILGNDMATVMPFAAIANAVQGLQNAADVPKSLEEALLPRTSSRRRATRRWTAARA